LRSEPQELFWITPEGLEIQVLSSNVQAMKDARLLREYKPVKERVYGNIVRLLKKITLAPSDPELRIKRKAPILFVHGSFHAAWCYAENYLDFFSSLGHQCFAVSLRGTSTTGMPPKDPGEIIQIEQHVSDIQCALTSMTALMDDLEEDGESSPDPIIISHSFGGLIVMKLLEDDAIRAKISAAGFLCSVPPSGNGPMTQRFIKTKFWDSMKIVWGFVFKAATIQSGLCRDIFFDKTVPAQDIENYMARFRVDSRVTLDIRSLDAILPSVTSGGLDGRATWLPPLVAKSEIFPTFNEGFDINIETTTQIVTQEIIGFPALPSNPSVLVVGAEEDFIIDKEGVVETAVYLGVEPVFIPDAYHDVMLGPKWRLSADVIAKWLETL